MTETPLVPDAHKMLKADLAKHIRTHHSSWGVSYGMTRADLRAVHEALHDGARYHDLGILTFPDDYELVPQFQGRPTHPLAIPHTHGDTGSEKPLTPEQQEAIEKAKAGEPISDKPLNASERTVLKQLVDNDFSRTATQIKQMAATALEVREASIQAAWKAKIEAADTYKAEVKKLAAKMRQEYNDLVEAAKNDGIELGRDKYTRDDAFRVYETAYTTNVTGLAAELKKAKDENTGLLQKALLDLEQQRLIVQARILRSALTDKTAAFLDTLPTAEQVMLEAQVQSGKALSGSATVQ